MRTPHSIKGSRIDHGAAVQEHYSYAIQQQSNRHPVKYILISCTKQMGRASATPSRLCTYRICGFDLYYSEACDTSS